MDIVLVAGMWLDGSAWDQVVPELERLGHRAVPLTLPGQGDGATDATYDDQVGAVVAEVDAATGPALVSATPLRLRWPGSPPTPGSARWPAW